MSVTHDSRLLLDIIKRHWGYDGFRPLQQVAMEAVMQGRDSLLVLPTGGGKSLCFQAPAMALRGTAVIVSPLIALMKDQVDALRAAGIPAACVHSAMEPYERQSVEHDLRQGELKFLYVAPERLVAEGFLKLLESARISFFAVDEAHCISQWGHDFRPEYRQLATLRQRFAGVAMHGYTATATGAVRADIVSQLRMQRPEVLVGSFDRSNLVMRVARRGVLQEQVMAVIDRHRGESGIVYCIRRKDVDELATQLCQKGVRAVPYHAGLADEVRVRNQNAFIRDDADVVVATVAFGMGINKSNVRFVVHAGLPKSLEHYQQESGRAGRDGLMAECLLLYSEADANVWRFLSRDLDGPALQTSNRQLQSVESYAKNSACRRRTILAYFGEQYPRENCDACDICLGDVEFVADPKVTAQKILSCVMRMKEAFPPDHVVDVLVGSRQARVLEHGHEQLSTHGLLHQQKRPIVRDWVEQLVAQGFLAREEESMNLKVTPRGWDVLRGKATPRLLQPATVATAVRPAKKSKAEAGEWQGVDRDLFDVLRDLRKSLAEQHKIAPYMIFGDRALREMARDLPRNRKQFLNIYGVGESKFEKWGEAFIDAVRRHAE